VRTMLKITVPVGAGNDAIQSGRLPQALKQTIDRLKPEAAYFFPEDGLRSAMFIFDLKDPSEIPEIAEPLFSAFHATVDFKPVMNLDDLQKGLGKIGQK